MLRRGKSCSRTNCCVFDCTNTYSNTDPTIRFYCLPNRWYEVERKQVWIDRIRRENDNTHWKPNAHTRICSAHFVGNVRSEHPDSPSFHPTIFSKGHMYLKSKIASDVDKQKRFERRMNRSKMKQEAFQNPDTSFFQFDQEYLKKSLEENDPLAPLKVDFCCQTNDIVSSDIGINDGSWIECILESDVVNVNLDVNSREVTTQVTVSTVDHIFVVQKKNKIVNKDKIKCGSFIKIDEKLNSLCGVSYDKFSLLHSLLTVPHENSKLTIENKLLLSLMKLKLGSASAALGDFFNLHATTCSRIFESIIQELVQRTKSFIFWPSREIIDQNMPEAFRKNYPKCRTIIDCIEIKIQQPKRVDQRMQIYSTDTNSFSAKYLIGIAPSGMITFVSKGYGGRSKDTFITNDCGFLDLLEPDDVVLSDKGFSGITCKDDAILVLPPLVHEERPTYKEVEETRTIASLRIHVERSIQRIKSFHIFQKISHNLVHLLDDIVRMCCVLVNLQPPIIKFDGV